MVDVLKIFFLLLLVLSWSWLFYVYSVYSSLVLDASLVEDYYSSCSGLRFVVDVRTYVFVVGGLVNVSSADYWFVSSCCLDVFDRFVCSGSSAVSIHLNSSLLT